VERLYSNVGASKTALEQAPEVLDTLSVDAAIHIFVDMVDRLVSEVFVLAQFVVSHMTVSEDVSIETDVAKNLCL
jgi:hypothetical protein